jgi:hypothetical protein
MWALRPRGDRRIGSAEDAATAVEAALAGFATVGAVVGADGAAALAVDGRGRVAVCKRQRAGIAVREVGWTAVRATAEGMLIDSGERSFGAVTVRGVDALDVRRLSRRSVRG